MKAGSRRILLQPPTIRTLVVLWAGSIFLAWTLLAGGWLAAKAELAEIADRVAADVKALSEARELESDILAHRREYLLWEATGRTDYLDRSREHLQIAERVAQSLDLYATTPQERELAAQIQSRLGSLREQWQSQLPAHSAAELTFETRWIDNLLAVLDEFQVQNEGQMNASIQATEHVRTMVSRWMIGLSVGTAVLLLGGTLGLIRRIIRPTLALTAATQSFGRGDFAAQTPVLHNDELGVLARTFNNMARDIADREKDRLQFVAMVVHDLKNPVLAIDMATRLLAGPPISLEQRGAYLAGIREEVARLRGIIRDLTEDVQVANGRFSVRKAELDLGALVRRFVEMQSKAFATHRLVVQADEGCTIEGDADRLVRVLANLVSNAVKYSPPGTRIRLRVENRQAHAVLTVSDEGPGIASEDLKVLFQPFGRGRSAHSLAEGTGMGLYVVKQIVEAHDGRIDVQSEPGHGATFQIRLPLVHLPDAVR